MLIFSYLHLSQVDFLFGNFSGKISSYIEYAEN